MGITITSGGRGPAERLYDLIADEARGLSFGERMQLFAAVRDGRPFATLPPNLRQCFERIAERHRDGDD